MRVEVSSALLLSLAELMPLSELLLLLLLPLLLVLLVLRADSPWTSSGSAFAQASVRCATPLAAAPVASSDRVFRLRRLLRRRSRSRAVLSPS